MRRPSRAIGRSVGRTRAVASWLGIAMALGLGACAAPVAERAKPESAQAPAPAAPATPAPTPTATPTPAPAPTPAAPAKDPRQELVARHREQAQAYERDGDLQRALLEWKVALTIDPDDAAARAGRAGVEGRIERGATEKIEVARAALARGVQAEARRQLLAALALDPANRTAFQMLQTQAREVDFVTHTVRSGDTLATLAQRYYGDSSRSEVIWETNQLPPNPRLVAGTTLKIPEIPGVPFVNPEARRVPPAAPAPGAPTAPRTVESPKAPEAPKEETAPQVPPLLADAREALDRNDYGGAISEADKFLATSPGNRDGLAVKKQALYRQAKTQLSDKKYEESYRALTQLAKLQPDYEDSATLLQQARMHAIEQHYGQGVRLYREEKLNEAIAEWRVVLEMDPQNANARRNIDQAEKLLKALEEKKKR